MKRKLALLLSILLVMSSLVLFTPVGTEAMENSGDKLTDAQMAQISERLRPEIAASWQKIVETGLAAKEGELPDVQSALKRDNKPLRVIVETKRGRASSAYSLNRGSSLVRSIAALPAMAGAPVEILNSFDTVMHGFSTYMPQEAIEAVEAMPEVEKVWICNEYLKPDKPMMVNSGDITKHPWVWEHLGKHGEGMVVAIIDSGVDVAHPDMVRTYKDKGLTQTKVREIKLGEQLPGDYLTDKVPYGWNYYDQSPEVKDVGLSASEHGMHVAGTVGANGKIKGVAPEAQLLAMKVFSNDPLFGSTYDDIYIAAIDDTVKLGGQVLNMSLGSPAGNIAVNSPIEKALNNAVEHGVVCAIAAGNETYMYQGVQNARPLAIDPDYGVVGTPAVQPASLAVASVDNSAVRMQACYIVKTTEPSGGEEEAILPDSSLIIHRKAFPLAQKDSRLVRSALRTAKKKNQLIAVRKNADEFVDLQEAPLSEADLAKLPDQVVYNPMNGSATYLAKVRGKKAEPAAGEETKIPFNPGGPLGGEMEKLGLMEVVDCGLGNSPDEFAGKELAGKIALMRRGQETFANKIKNAAEAGAKAAIVYDSADSQVPFGMAGVEAVTIPACSIRLNDGLALKEAGRVRFAIGETANIDLPTAGKMSSFSSWGPAPNLSIKPEISAPGGNIYSTLNDGKYGMMSGTSMATPHVAGASALMRQYVEEIAPTLSSADKAAYSKVLMMNTAELVKSPFGENYLEPVRHQGAGSMNLQRAMSNKVAVTKAGSKEAKLELKELPTKQFSASLDVRNFGTEAKTYTASIVAMKDVALTLTNGKSVYAMAGQKVQGQIGGDSQLTVEGGQTQQLNLSYDFSADDIMSENFIEGFVILTDEEGMTLHVPFLGFYGDWRKPRRLESFAASSDTPQPTVYDASFMTMFTQNGILLTNKGSVSTLKAAEGSVAAMLGLDNNNLLPIPTLQRNLYTLDLNICDRNDQVMTCLAKREQLRKNYFNNGRGRKILVDNGFAWNGTSYGVPLPDDQYYFDFVSTLYSEDNQPTHHKVPVYLDSTAPEIKGVTVSDKHVKFTASDNLTGIQGMVLVLIDAEGQQEYGSILAINAVTGNTDQYSTGSSDLLRNFDVDLTSMLAKAEQAGSKGQFLEIHVIDDAYNDCIVRRILNEEGVVQDDKADVFILKPEVGASIGLDPEKNEQTEARVDVELVVAAGQPFELYIDGEKIVEGPDAKFEEGIFPISGLADKPVDIEGVKITTHVMRKPGYHQMQFDVRNLMGDESVQITRPIFIDLQKAELTLTMPEAERLGENHFKVQKLPALIHYLCSDDSPYVELKCNGQTVARLDRPDAGFTGVGNPEYAAKLEGDFKLPFLKAGTNSFEFVLEDMVGNRTTLTLVIDYEAAPAGQSADQSAEQEDEAQAEPDQAGQDQTEKPGEPEDGQPEPTDEGQGTQLAPLPEDSGVVPNPEI